MQVKGFIFGMNTWIHLALCQQLADGGVMVWVIFSWHILGHLIPTENCLNAAAYLRIVDHVHPFMATVNPPPSIRHHQIGSTNMTMSLVCFQWLSQSAGDVVEGEICSMTVQL